MKPLRPQPMHDKYSEPIEMQLKRFIFSLIYQPLKDLMREEIHQQTIENVNLNPIEKAIALGSIQYDAGIFSGRFNAAISRVLRQLGAQFDKKQHVFKMPVEDVPDSIRILSSGKKAKLEAMSLKIKAKLDAIQAQIPEVVDQTHILYDKTIQRVSDDFKKIYPRVIIGEVSPESSAEFIRVQNKEYSQKIRPFIKDWAEEEIMQLRQDVTDNARAGYRADHLVARIQRRYGSSKAKAKFIARQETGLFMAQYRKERFLSSGVRKFKWSTSHDSRVRDDHKNLEGRVFPYSDPPIVDQATGRRGLPGQDFGCRCVDIPLLEQAA